MCYDIHPRYLGIDMTPDQRMEVEEMIYSHPTSGRDLTAELQGVAGKQYSSTFHFSTLLVHSAVPGTASLAYTCMTNNTFRS